MGQNIVGSKFPVEAIGKICLQRTILTKNDAIN